MPKKQKYRLEPLVLLKNKQKRKTEIALAKAIKAVDEEKTKLKRLEDLKKEIIQKRLKARTQMRDQIATGQARIKDSHFHLGFMEKLKEDEERMDHEIKDQKENIKQAEEKLKRARRDYMDAASELNIMEKHKELWMKKQSRMLSALENKMMNELGNTVFQMNRMKEG